MSCSCVFFLVAYQKKRKKERMIAIGWRARSSQVVKCPWQRSPVKRKLKEKKMIINKIKVEHEKKI